MDTNSNVSESFFDKRNDKVYKTFQVGTQIWMAENLCVDTFLNGDPIRCVEAENDWFDIGSKKYPALCYYNNNASYFRDKFGILYNWYAVNDQRGLAPEGWHVPSDEEWTQLINELISKNKRGMGKIYLGREMKHSGGFNGLMGGSRSATGIFYGRDGSGGWWSSTERNISGDIDFAWGRFLSYNRDLEWEELDRLHSGKSSGWSVRCVKD